MRITWVTRSFLDYRIPLYRELAGRSGVDFTLLTSAEDFCTPVRVRHKAQEILGDRVTFLAGERCIGKPYDPEQRSNSVRRIFYQPGLIKKILATRPDIVITDAFNHWTLPVLWLRTHHNFRHIVCYERTAHTERNASRGKLRFLSFARHWVGRRTWSKHWNYIRRAWNTPKPWPGNRIPPGVVGTWPSAITR